MDTLNVGDRVIVNRHDLPKYVTRYTKVRVGYTGTILRITDAGSIGVEFDDIIFDTERYYPINNGCHDYGKKNYCLYLPITNLDLLYEYQVPSDPQISIGRRFVCSNGLSENIRNDVYREWVHRCMDLTKEERAKREALRIAHHSYFGATTDNLIQERLEKLRDLQLNKEISGIYQDDDLIKDLSEEEILLLL